MQWKRLFFIMIFLATVCVCDVHASCSYDHFLVGQDDGTLFLDTSQLYRHWNTDYGTNPDPYGQEYYEFTDTGVNGDYRYLRTEPGFGELEGTAYDLTGTRGVDYNICLQLVYATEGLNFAMPPSYSPIFTGGVGDTFCLSDFLNHHVHMAYHLSNLMDPEGCYTVSYRLTDSEKTYEDSEVYTFYFGAAPEPEFLLGDANHDGVVSAGDYACVQANFGNTGALGGELMGDANGDGVISAGDYASVQANFGNTAAAVAPEPASMLLLAIGGLALLRRQRNV